MLAQSSDGGGHFSLVYSASQSKFVEIYPLVVDNASIPGLPKQPGLPEGQGQGVLLFGAGQYRQSDPYLAYVPLDKISDHSAWQYFAGLQGGSARWSPNEADATALFDQPCLGEFSAQHNTFLNKWLLLYSCNSPRGINFRLSDTPWGSWSQPQVLFNATRDNAYCAFLHQSFSVRHCDTLSDPGRENVSGGEYAPALISRFTTGDATQTTLYFLMSTWNPYEVVLMKATLRMG